MIYDAFGFSSNYPKMWFYLSLRLVYTCLLGLVKSTILFLCSFQGTSARSFSTLLCCFLLAFGRRTFDVRLSQARRRASYCEKITSQLCGHIRFLLSSHLWCSLKTRQCNCQ